MPNSAIATVANRNRSVGQWSSCDSAGDDHAIATINAKKPLIASHFLSMRDSGKITQQTRTHFVGHVLEHPLPRVQRRALVLPPLADALECLVIIAKQACCSS